ncbi:MAG TPA: tRNA (N6-isopentenyl adenosine(37)-C2)-methylthiotransferase MiaB [Blastocatellia bacterium]|nr:tRNA (N6-isopentenyl adenosine(37)-C2)-methylthiotransferase MiaB [Blastocatellia bacterium]
MRFYLETFGCQMNVNDSERVASLLSQNGYQPSKDARSADLILLNTCSIREKAASKVYSRIGELKRTANSKNVIFGVIGCVAQDEAETIFRKSQAVRLVMGPRSIGRLPVLLSRLEQGYPRAIDVAQNVPSEFTSADASSRINQTTGFVTIIEGCNKNCSYCIVPYTRGRENSRSPEAILAEIDMLISAGYKEICLLGQNVNSYKYADDKGEVTFAKLLQYLARRTTGIRIKFTTSYPRDFDRDLVKVLAENENLCNWIHLPVQSGSDNVLRRMYRQYTRKSYMDRIEMIRNCGREMSLTGDFIVGFPGETEEDFQETLSLLDEVKYDGIYSFAYSPRPHTPAAFFTDSVPSEVKNERLSRLIEHQAGIQKANYQRYIGRKLEVLVEGKSARQSEMTGHSPCNRVVNFMGSEDLAGKMVSVEVTKANNNSLFGELC